MNKEFEKILFEEIANHDTDIFSFHYQEKKYWLKQARATQSSKLHKFYYFLFPFEVLLPVKTKSEIEALEFEVTKLQELNQNGILTPLVVYQGENFFVLEDCGKNINSFIRKRDITEENMYFYLDKLIETLAKIHNKGFFHGGAQARNFTIKNDKVYAIDLEDSFEDSIDLKLLQFRDLLLLLLSLTKTRANFELDYNYVIQKYIVLTGNENFQQQLKRIATKLSFFYLLVQNKWIKSFLGRDVQGFFKLIGVLKEL